jgi:hypothetical protein
MMIMRYEVKERKIRLKIRHWLDRLMKHRYLKKVN